MPSNDRTTTRVDFGKHEARINKGEIESLKGWWGAWRECAQKCEGNPAQYARLASKQARKNTENTIAQYLRAIRAAENMGYTLDYFVSHEMGIEHLRATVAGKGQREVRKVSNVSMPVQRAQKAIRGMNRLELKAVIAEAQKALKAL